jgi:hypothetical protein
MLGPIGRKLRLKALRFARPSPGGQTAIVVDDDVLKLVNANGQDRQLARGVRESWFSADGKRVYYRRDDQVHFVSQEDDTQGSLQADDAPVQDTATGPRGLEAFIQRDRLTVLDPESGSSVFEQRVTGPDGPEFRSVAFAPDGKLAVGWLDIRRAPGRDADGNWAAGQANVGVNLYQQVPSTSPVPMPPISVELWNRQSPRVDFDGRRLIVFTWPSVWEWRPA